MAFRNAPDSHKKLFFPSVVTIRERSFQTVSYLLVFRTSRDTIRERNQKPKTVAMRKPDVEANTFVLRLSLTLSLPRVINVKFLLQPHQ